MEFKVGDIISWKEDRSDYAARKGAEASVVSVRDNGCDVGVKWSDSPLRRKQMHGAYPKHMFILVSPSEGSGRNKDSGGVKNDAEKIRLDLVPESAILALGRVLTFGAKKYDPYNWKKGITYSRVYSALLRHLTAWHSGEDTDPESGLSHLDHALCNVAFLRDYIENNRTELDDRFKKEK